MNFKNAISRGHNDIFRYYAGLQGCHVDDVEDAIKTEGLVPTAHKDSNDSQIIVYDDTQHTLLANIRELVGLQSMYSKNHPDDGESFSGTGATTSGVSGPTVSTPSHVTPASQGKLQGL
ncbi:hypothetical protein DPSP01_000001 [Paraphaeosphaeria sporulosa]